MEDNWRIDLHRIPGAKWSLKKNGDIIQTFASVTEALEELYKHKPKPVRRKCDVVELDKKHSMKRNQAIGVAEIDGWDVFLVD